MDYSKRLDDVMDEYLQVFAKDPNDILTDDMTDYDKIKKLEQAIQSGASDEWISNSTYWCIKRYSSWVKASEWYKP